MKKSTKFTALQQQVNELANQLTRITAQHDIKMKSLKEEKDNLAEFAKQEKSLLANVSTAKKNWEKNEALLTSEKSRLKELAESVAKQESFLETLATGISASEGKDNGFAEQIQSILDMKRSDCRC